MDVRGVGIASDLGLIALRGRVVDHGGYIVATTPDDPGYHNGNLLVLPAAPAPGELAAAVALFARELGAHPAIRHVTLYWDGATGAGADDELAAAGFERTCRHAMAARAVRPAAPPPDLAVRVLAPDELMRAAELAFTLAEPPDEPFRQFLHRRGAAQRDLVLRGVARFWGAFDDGTLVASLGLVRLGRLCRYQDVQTAAAHRRHGVAAALLAIAAGDDLAADAEQLVICTVAGSDAERVYERAGFRTVEHIVSAHRSSPVS
jgi:GNAT superfamily N-acetyltransferase